MIWSFSRLSLYEACPYRFCLKYIDGRSEPVTKPLALGKAVHKALERRTAGDPDDLAMLAGLAEADFHPGVTREELQRLLRMAPRVRGETEVHFQLPLARQPGAPQLQGFIDLVQEGAFLDWKTHLRPYSIRSTRQLALYAWALMTLRGWEAARGTLYFLRFRQAEAIMYTPEEAEQARAWAYNLAQNAALAVSLLELFPELRKELFPATPGTHCRHCPFAAECRMIWGNGREFSYGEIPSF